MKPCTNDRWQCVFSLLCLKRELNELRVTSVTEKSLNREKYNSFVAHVGTEFWENEQNEKQKQNHMSGFMRQSGNSAIYLVKCS